MRWIEPEWPAPSHVHALTTERGASQPDDPHDGFNFADYVADVQDEYAELRDEYYASLEDRKYLTLDQAISKRGDVSTEKVAPVPSHLGARVVEEELSEVVPFIDWNPFFQTWELRGRYPNRGYPKIFNDETVGAEAKKLLDARGMPIVAGCHECRGPVVGAALVDVAPRGHQQWDGRIMMGVVLDMVLTGSVQASLALVVLISDCLGRRRQESRHLVDVARGHGAVQHVACQAHIVARELIVHVSTPSRALFVAQAVAACVCAHVRA
mgnify:CR=1 FL=1